MLKNLFREDSDKRKVLEPECKWFFWIGLYEKKNIPNGTLE